MSDAPFTWPPREPSPLAVSPDIFDVSASRPRASLPHALCEMWLAPDAPRLAHRMRETGWAPDEMGAWCDRCAATVGPHEEDEFGCSACRGKRLPWERAVRLGEHSGALRDWVHEVKFTRFRALGIELGRELGKRLRASGLPGKGVVVCPAPTSWRRRMARGIDHSGAIALGVAQEIGAARGRLLRRAHRPSQQELAASERKRNLRGAFSRTGRADLSRTTVVLVDDVLTTGATARGAARALRRGSTGASAVWLAVLGAAPRPGSDER